MAQRKSINASSGNKKIIGPLAQLKAMGFGRLIKGERRDMDRYKIEFYLIIL